MTRLTTSTMSEPGRAVNPAMGHSHRGLVLQRRCACGGAAGGSGECEECRKKRLPTLQRFAVGPELDRVPPVVQEVLRSPGQALDPEARSYFEARFGHDFSLVRVHTDSRSAASANAVSALAYTVGRNVVFADQQYQPTTAAGRHLLAHELTHVVQQSRDGPPTEAPLRIGDSGDAAEREAASVAAQLSDGKARASAAKAHDESRTLRRFTVEERDQITRLDSVMETARRIAEARGVAYMMRWGRFTAGTGGTAALEHLTPVGSQGPKLPNRYLFTCRCGLIDMQHFYQLMYLALAPFAGGGRGATRRGREHELTAEVGSRFAPEDSPSNALGAFFGSQQAVFERQSVFLENLRTYLGRCNPVDFTRMSRADQEAVVDYYGRRDAGGAPANPNETATPAVLNVTACAGATRTFPFVLDPADPNQSTISGIPAVSGIPDATTEREGSRSHLR